LSSRVLGFGPYPSFPSCFTLTLKQMPAVSRLFGTTRPRLPNLVPRTTPRPFPELDDCPTSLFPFALHVSVTVSTLTVVTFLGPKRRPVFVLQVVLPFCAPMGFLLFTPLQHLYFEKRPLFFYFSGNLESTEPHFKVLLLPLIKI